MTAGDLSERITTVLRDWGVADLRLDACTLGAKNCIFIPKTDDDGFDIEIYLDSEEITVFGEGVHRHFSREGPSDDTASQVLEFARALGSKRWRTRVRRASGSPYWWVLERQVDGTWVREEGVGLIFFNYFGKRDEIFLQNSRF
jgi:hypothetical protein